LCGSQDGAPQHSNGWPIVFLKYLNTYFYLLFQDLYTKL
jgi:hypothetical protein